MTRRVLIVLTLVAAAVSTLHAARLRLFIDGDNRTPYDASRGKAGRAEWTAAVNARKGGNPLGLDACGDRGSE